MTNRYTISFVNNFSFYDSNNPLEPSYDWDAITERLHPRGRIGHMLCESVPSESNKDYTIVDVGRSEQIARRFDDSANAFGPLLTRVVMSERPLIETDSKHECDLGINLVLSDEELMTPGWHRSTVPNIHAVVAIPSFDERFLVLRFIRDVILELSVALSSPVKSALHLWSGADTTDRVHFPFEDLFARKVDYLKAWLASGNSNSSVNHVYHDAQYVAFSSFVRHSDSAEHSAEHVINFWDNFINTLVSAKRPSAQEIARSLANWPKLGGQLNISTIASKIERYAKPGVNYLIMTPAEKVREKLSLERYEVIQADELLSKRFNDLRTANKKGRVNSHAIKFYSY